MRRKDREIINRDEIINIINKCNVCRIALLDKSYPYIIPMNFGIYYDDINISLYFHCANEGKKLDLINKNRKACFEMDTSHKIIIGSTACACTMEYESVIGTGEIELLCNEEKKFALDMIVKKYTNKENFKYNEEHLKAVTVLKLTVSNITAKRLKLSEKDNT